MIKNKTKTNKVNALQSKKLLKNISISYHEFFDKANDQFRGANMVEINPKSFTAYLLSEVIHDPQRQSMFQNIVNNGIYEMFIDENHSRDDVKRCFQMALSDRMDEDKATEIRNYLFEEYPEIFFYQQQLIKNQKTLKKKILQSEIEIFNDCSRYFSQYLKCWCNRGRIIVSKKDLNLAMRLFNNIISDHFGICIPIVVTDI